MKPVTLYNLTLAIAQTEVEDRAKLNKFFKRLGRGYGIRVKSVIKVNEKKAEPVVKTRKPRAARVLNADNKQLDRQKIAGGFKKEN